MKSSWMVRELVRTRAMRGVSKWCCTRRTFASKAPIENTKDSNKTAASNESVQVNAEATDCSILNKPLVTSQLVHPIATKDWQVIQKDHFRHVPIPSWWEKALEEFQLEIGLVFRDSTHLMCALVHHGALPLNLIPEEITVHRLSNRSLEFLGDSILGMTVASYLFQVHPIHSEGQLTLAKSALVNNRTLSKICVNDLQMDKLILVAPDYSLARRRSAPIYVKGRNTIQAGAVEALIAAIYLDQGLVAALEFVNKQVLPHAIRYATEEETVEPITELQTMLQAHGYKHPIYKYLPAPANSPEFQVTLIVKGESVLTESGPSYKAARVKAAEAGIQHFKPLLAPKIDS